MRPVEEVPSLRATVRVLSDDLEDAVRVLLQTFPARRLQMAIDTRPPASGPEAEISASVPVDDLVAVLQLCGISVLASRE